MKNRSIEPYQDTMTRLYPELNPPILPNKTHNLSSMTVTFQVTTACSLACSYCYQINKGTDVMSFETAKTFIDNLIADKYKGYISLEEKPFIILEFIGGEPFLQPLLIEQICDYWYDTLTELMHPWAEHSMISLCTNGMHWFEPEVQHFLYKYHQRLSVSITIDGDKDLHDSCRRFADGRPSYDLAWAAAQDWIKKGGYMGSKVTICPANLQYMNQAIKHFIENGYTEINANTVYEKGWTIEHAKEYYQHLKSLADYVLENNLEDTIFISLFTKEIGYPENENNLQTWCGGNGNNMLAIDPHGNFYPCVRYMASSLGNDQNPLIIGNVWDGFGTNNQEQQWIKCMECINRRTEMTDECFYCPIGVGCSECSAYNYQLYGTPDHHSTLCCDMHKARCLANYYYWNKYYRKKEMSNRMQIFIPDEWALEIIDQQELIMLKQLSTLT